MVGPDDPGHGLGWGHGHRVSAPQLYQDLAVRIAPGQLFGQCISQSRFADASHSSQAGDCGSPVKAGQQILQLFVPAGEVPWRRRQVRN